MRRTKNTEPVKPNKARTVRKKAVLTSDIPGLLSTRADLNHADKTELKRLYDAGNVPQEGENPLQGRTF